MKTLLRFLLFCLVLPVQAERFHFKYAEGDVYRILSTVNESVIINGRYSHDAEILNRISVKITGAGEDGSGTHDALFMTSEQSVGSTGQHFSWGREYHSVFTRSALGGYAISDEYFMPVVRDVPLFPDRELYPGDTWTAKGYEAHDLRPIFGFETPFMVPFDALYVYEGTEEEGGRMLHRISVSYDMSFKTPDDFLPAAGDEWTDFPTSTQVKSHQMLFWDNELGQIDHYKEDFRIVIETAAGNTFEFTGSAHAETTYIPVDVSSDAKREEVQGILDNLGVENTEVRVADEGLTISIENIQFKADSAELEESEKDKLRKIALVLEQFPDNDLLISGHTALAGSAAGRQALSEQRAGAVADFLIELGVKDRYHIFTRGFGADRPVADNDSAEGKAKNRRVEITIMDR